MVSRQLARLFIAVLAATYALGMLAGPPRIAVAQESLTAEIANQAKLQNNGQAVRLTISVYCPAGYEVLEAFVYITQDGNQSQYGRIPVRCDGKQHGYTVRVIAYDGRPFQYGSASASGYILVYNPTTGTTQSTSPTQDITIR